MHFAVSPEELSQLASHLRSFATETRSGLEPLQARLGELFESWQGRHSAASAELLGRLRSSGEDVATSLEALAAYLDSARNVYQEAESQIRHLFET